MTTKLTRAQIAMRRKWAAACRVLGSTAFQNVCGSYWKADEVMSYQQLAARIERTLPKARKGKR